MILFKYTKNFKNTYKKIKKHEREHKNYLDILYYLEQTNDIKSLLENPIFSMYGIERMKYEYKDFYSFNLCKNGGVIRLIVKLQVDLNIIYFVHISYNHYDDFTLKKGDVEDE